MKRDKNDVGYSIFKWSRAYFFPKTRWPSSLSVWSRHSFMFLKKPALCARWYSIACPTNAHTQTEFSSSPFTTTSPAVIISRSLSRARPRPDLKPGQEGNPVLVQAQSLSVRAPSHTIELSVQHNIKTFLIFLKKNNTIPQINIFTLTAMVWCCPLRHV